MPHLVAAPDKYRGTATAAEAAAAMVRGARRVGWTAEAVPMADGGEGTLEVVGGRVRRTLVAGPVGPPVVARWSLLDADCARRIGARSPAALVEAAQAVGRALVPRPRGDDPVGATTEGVGQLVLAAVAAGAAEIVVAVGGTATTDGGWGALRAIEHGGGLRDAVLTVACDVRTAFGEAAATFGPQKGADPSQVALLTGRLEGLAARYRAERGVDLDRLPGAGAGGGLAGGLAAAGGRLVPGLDLVARAVGLAERLERADLVVTGEGRLDRTSFDGKVVGAVIDAVGGRAPVLCVVGDADPGLELPAVGPGAVRPVEVVRLVAAVGPERSWEAAPDAIETVVADRLAAPPVPG